MEEKKTHITKKKILATDAASRKKLHHLKRRHEFDESKTRMTLDYLFGSGVSKKIDFSKIVFVHSRKTGRIKQLENRASGKVMFTFRPNGSIAPTLLGARAMLYGSTNPRARWIVKVIDGVSEIVSSGKTVFCKHVVSCENALCAGDDVIILNERKELLAVGRALINGSAMKQFKRGQAVKVREGANKHAADESE
jgi:predicted RNA-binding protein (TIGR00451 family)